MVHHLLQENMEGKQRHSVDLLVRDRERGASLNTATNLLQYVEK